MKNDDGQPTRREYPHVITQGLRQNHRWMLAVSNKKTDAPGVVEDFVFVGAGYVDDAGRRAIVKRINGRARTSRARYCVVWSPDGCTWIEGDGMLREGKTPPLGNSADPWANASQPATVEWCWTIELPKGAEWSHICVRRIDANLVEIAPGEPMVLADFNEPDVPGLPDPAAGLLGPDGKLVAPRTYRGQPVTGIRDEWTLLGPVQPQEDGTFLRNPWPDDVADACDAIAGMSLPRRIHNAAWQAIYPNQTDVIYVGVLKAA
ncbi:hypothetical protein [Sphingomonas adhaesiva]|uniref:Uncharacterized protein n=1 Tax=Sphingomonas adhaesiva TaxID=28212 RepID=A0A2A4ID60_9SPHN|nr:hypothetical protein [Sphingomonas adhaesiva]PCG15760.1 hypothetical protein COA07_01910 [Sphingomonas adhaesiva]